jgi:predicted extracellular nuclease
MPAASPTRRRIVSLVALALLASLLPVVTAAPALAATAGDVVITEVMQNPDAVDDDAGEWFELHNTTGSAINLDNWTVSDNDLDSFQFGGTVIIPPGGYVVIGNNDDPATNGGVGVNYTYDGTAFFLANGADELVIADPAANPIDTVAWDDGATFPDPTGASMSLDPASTNSTDNDDGANWCEATTELSGGDLGTPGAPNDDCEASPPPPPPPAVELVINEVMQNPSAVADADGEWFEIHNPTSSDVDIDGWTIADNDSDSHVISNGGPLVVPAGGYVVLGNNADSVSNGGLTVDYVFSGIALANGADELVLFDTAMSESDRIEWDGGPGWPDPNGASMTLADPTTDNNDGTNWCEATTEYGDGDNGTPGEANDSCAASPPPPPPPPPPPVVTIAEIQGAGHISPFADVEVTTTGVVTAIGFDTMYVQDPVGDGDDSTSEAISVFMGSGFGNSPTVAVGDLIEMTDVVTEFIPGGASTGNLSTTQMSFPSISIISSGNPLPEPVVIGKSGRLPPAVDVISDDEVPVNLQFEAGLFDPENDGIDFYEAVEAMRVTVEDPKVVSATRTFSSFSSEFFTVTNRGRYVRPRYAFTRRGALELQPDPDNQGDQNPERVQIQFDASIGNPGTLYPGDAPSFDVGAKLRDVTGVVGYSFGNYEVNATELVTGWNSRLREEHSRLRPGRHWLTVASYNVLNLSPDASDDTQRAKLASQIVDNLNSPDVIALQEIQDDSGETDDGTTTADLTLQALADAVAAAGGPTYAYLDNPPADNSEGGVPGGNIRVAFLYNPKRVDLLGSTSLSPAELAAAGVSNPEAFAGTRTPLVGRFEFNGKEIHVVSNHFSSRFGSTPIFGGPQPFVQAGETEREAAAAALNEYVDHLIAQDRHVRVMVVGDMNTFQWTDDLTEILPGTGRDRVLTNLVGSRYRTDRDDTYTYIFDGNAQVLDNFFVTRSLKRSSSLDIVHVNVDFARVPGEVTASDHEPLLGRFYVRAPERPRHHPRHRHHNRYGYWSARCFWF